MRIKRVVIQGFKTFAHRTEFVFDPGITAVVGPNGSGKSNIVDAVRWCLGEQSFSLLRSKKTSDVIFSGSDKKARLGMAQVSLLLDNSGGEIPLDYTEVEITRRAYRDGDNEYFVNGQRIRLQDVVQILAQTGLGKRTYAVIGQGLIDRVLSLAPEERRALFEEAAGLTGYHAKREATLRRLDATEINLTRVRDVTAELAPRLTTLRRQAERAREREQHALDLRGLLREWYGFKWHAALESLAEHTDQAAALQERIDEQKLNLAELNAQIDGLRARQAELRTHIGEQHASAAELHRVAEATGRELAITEEKQRQAAARSAELEEELAPLLIQLESTRNRMGELESAAASARVEFERCAGERAETERSLGVLRGEQDALREAVTVAREHLDRVRRLSAERRARAEQLTERVAILNATIEMNRGAHEGMDRRAGQAAAELALIEEKHRLLETRAEEVSEAIRALDAARVDLRRRLEEAEQTRREKDRSVDNLQTRHDMLRRLTEEGAGMASGVRAVLQANLPGILGVVGALLRMPQQYERAVEMALGGALQNVVAAKWGDAQSAIDYLKREQRGRATFLPLDRLNTLPAIAAPHMDGVIGNAAELVGCDESVAEARDHLLNRTWIVRDLPTARRALDSLRQGPRPTVVTLEGDIVRPGGAVTGGSDSDRRDDASILARARELRDLPGQIESGRSEANRLAAACSDLARERAAMDGQFEQQQQTLGDLAREERALRPNLESARRASDQAAQSLAWLVSQLAANQDESRGLDERVRQLDADAGQVEEQERAAMDALAQAEAGMAAAAADTLLGELADRRAAEAVAEGQLQSRLALLAEHKRALDELAAQRDVRANRLAELRLELERLSAMLETLAARDRESARAIAVVQAEISPQEAQLEIVRAEQETAESAERTLQQAVHSAESAWTHASLAMQRSEDAVRQLRSEIERDLGLVALTQSEDVAYQPPLPIDEFVESLPVYEEVAEGLEEEMAALRGRLARLVNINPDAPREYDEAAERYEFLTSQAEDLEAAAADLRKVIAELDQIMRSELTRTFREVAAHFKTEFEKLFVGGTAELLLTDPENIAESGIEIIARPPGKRPQSLALLSGGERSLSACALIFAILRVSPTPFCVLDEVDAALDEANVDRFRQAVEDLAGSTQFIIVTHNRRTLEGSSTIYGITMGSDGVSRVISLRLEGGHIVHGARPATGDAAVSAPEESAMDDEGTDLSQIEEIVQM